MDVLQQLQADKATQKYLLVLARETIEQELGVSSVERKSIESPILQQKVGVFVTLKSSGELRGCIGSLQDEYSLGDGVAYYAKQAAFHDPRFPPLSKDELEHLTIELSILSPLEKLTVTSRDDLRACVCVGQDGLYVIRDLNRATFLPKVWRDISEFDTFIDHLLYKAGLDPSSWYSDAQWFRYQALDID